jgi:hypothetical protein
MNRRALGALIVQAGGAAVVAATIPTKIASALAEKPTAPNALSITPAEVGRQVIWTDGLQAPTLAVLTADGVEAAYAANPHHPEIAAAYAKLMRGPLQPGTSGAKDEIAIPALADYRLEVTQPMDAAYYGQSFVPPEATALHHPELVGQLGEEMTAHLMDDPSYYHGGRWSKRPLETGVISDEIFPLERPDSADIQRRLLNALPPFPDPWAEQQQLLAKRDLYFEQRSDRSRMWRSGLLTQETLDSHIMWSDFGKGVMTEALPA